MVAVQARAFAKREESTIWISVGERCVDSDYQSFTCTIPLGPFSIAEDADTPLICFLSGLSLVYILLFLIA